MNLINDCIGKHPVSFFYSWLGILSLIMGVIMKDNLTQSEDPFVEIYGMLMMIFASFLIITAYVMYKIDKLEAQMRKIERDSLLQDLQQEEQS